MTKHNIHTLSAVVEPRWGTIDEVMHTLALDSYGMLFRCLLGRRISVPASGTVRIVALRSFCDERRYVTGSSFVGFVPFMSGSLEGIRLKLLHIGIRQYEMEQTISKKNVGTIISIFAAIMLVFWGTTVTLASDTGPENQLILEKVEPGNSCSYFGKALPNNVTTFASDTDAERVISDIMEASGLVQNFRVRAAGVPNAAALILDEKRLILYNQFFMQNIKKITGNEWAAISIMAHEIGHHLNGHTLGDIGSTPKKELEADWFSGFILQRMGASMEDARVAMDEFGSLYGSDTHPAKHDRLAAISNGWIKACHQDPNCSNNGDSGERKQIEKPRKPGPNSCEYAYDDECDEPDLCETGTDTSDCRPTSPQPQQPQWPQQSRWPQQLQSYCCDYLGRKWCPMAVPTPLGSLCWCQGVIGSGVVCN